MQREYPVTPKLRIVRVRESLEFSALMRQGGNRSRKEKLAYVDEVMQLLELTPLADVGKLVWRLLIHDRQSSATQISAV
jgi:hypothetical protein